jgi:fructose-1,6-bisphosphatase-3
MDPIHLRTLAHQFPNTPAALAELANLEAILTLPVPTVHVVSDVHGEHAKLRQVINNASGSLRPLVERLLGGPELLDLIYDPRAAYLARTAGMTRDARRPIAARVATQSVVVIRELARRYTLQHIAKIFPDPYDAMLRELVFGEALGRSDAFVAALIEPFVETDREVELVRMLARIIRNLAIGELIVAGDLGDRGPRIDQVIEVLIQQPTVSITWGNHDADWMAACLGQPAAIATVVRLSLRYQRLSQLEDGYGISLRPLEDLARACYGDDPATRFAVKGEPAGDPVGLARMHKAAAVMQLKLEGALFRRKPEWGLAERALLHRIDPGAGSVDLDGATYPLLDPKFPTVDWADPYALSADEQRCFDALHAAFTGSAALWRHMSYVAAHGAMWLRRDRCAIFHGCLPVDDRGDFLPVVVDGAPRTGRALLDALEVVVQRAMRSRAPDDVDVVFWLWTGPRSPCFGKDRMATFETYFIADPATHEETKNPYFALIHDAGFCAKVLRELGVDPDHGFIINGHVPVRLDQGETPIKRSGRAITIDGAFAAAYGDKGFSLVLDAERMYLAQHHHVTPGADIIPTVSDVVVYDRPRTVGDTERGDELRGEIVAVRELIAAFDANQIRPR